MIMDDLVRMPEKEKEKKMYKRLCKVKLPIPENAVTGHLEIRFEL